MSEIDDWLLAYADGLHTPQAVKEKLAAALLDAGMMKLAARSLQGEWSDFDSEHATPKMALVVAIMNAPYGSGGNSTKAQRSAFAERVKQGEFDG